MVTRYMRETESSVQTRVDDALRLSKDFIRHIYEQDFDWCINRIKNDFIWIGTQKDFFTTTKDDFSKTIRGGAEYIHAATITDEEYTVVSCTERVFCVSGKYLVLTLPEEDEINAHWHRCTLIWQKQGKRNLLVHLHISSPVDYMEEGENYPISAGTETYRYMRSLRKIGSSRKSVSLYDVNGTVHWVHPSQIIYLEANRKRTIVHCMTKDIVVPAVIRDAIEMTDNKVMRVHRSYAVNRDHVVELKAGRLLLDDGTSIAIPAKRIADVRAGLMGR